MLASVGLTLSGLVFTLLIAIIYFSKKKYKDVENKLYGFLLLWTIFLLLLELYCVFTMRIRQINPVLNEILCRTYIFGDIVWIISVVIYVLILNKQESYKTGTDLFRNPAIVFFMLLGLGSFIFSCFLPITYTSGRHNELYVIGGKSVYSLYIVSTFVGAYVIFELFKNSNKISLFKRLPIFFFIIFYFIMFIFQYFYTDINDLTFMFGVSVVAMYFTIVSQDNKLVDDLEVAKSEAEEANKEKTEFLSKMSHEIRTPMNAIMGFSESLLNDKDLTEEKVLNDSKNIYIAANNLISTINNILDVSRIESGKEKVINNQYFIGDIIYDLEDFVLERIDKERINFNIDFDENTPCLLLGDKSKIHKILLNILSNSIRYTVSGDIDLKVETVCDKGFANLVITIKDTGVGIKEEDFDKVFMKFAKLETDIKELERGAGLGLSIAKSLANMMDGDITFDSKYNVGTTFTVTLKNKILDYHKCGDILAKKDVLKAIEHKVDGAGKRIMVIDDNKLNLKIVDKLFRGYGFDVTLVESGETCLEILNKHEHYDLILIDYLMPELDGIETIRKIRKLNMDLPPILLTTANIDQELKDKCIKEGFDGYLSKPIDMKKVSGIVNYYFKK